MPDQNSKVQLSKHQGPAIKIYYLATLANMSNRDLPTQPTTDFPVLSLKTATVEPPVAVPVQSRGSHPPALTPTPPRLSL